jgi:hypothetical protein
MFFRGVLSAISMSGDSTAISLTGGNQTGAIPTLESGKLPQYLRLSFAGNAAFFTGIGTATATSGIMLGTDNSVIYKVPAGHTHFAATTLAGTLNNQSITPLAAVTELPAALSIAGDGLTASVTSAATTALAIPTTSSGKKAKYVIVQGHNACLFRPGSSGDDIHSSLTGARIRQSVDIVNVSGYSHMLFCKQGAGSAVIYMSPLEG